MIFQSIPLLLHIPPLHTRVNSSLTLRLVPKRSRHEHRPATIPKNNVTLVRAANLQYWEKSGLTLSYAQGWQSLRREDKAAKQSFQTHGSVVTAIYVTPAYISI
jgi:hypothetical protein